MKRTIAIISVLLILFVGISFMSCKKEAAAPEVVFWTSHGPPANGILEEIVNNYNATSPAIKVKFVQVPGSETDNTALMTAVRGGTGPDVYMLDRFIVAQRAADGVLEDLTSAINTVDPNFKDKVLPFAWEEAQYRGKTYAFPFDTDTRGLFYNIDVLRAAGVDPAEFSRSNGPMTLTRLWEICQRIDVKDAQGNYTRVGFIPQVSQGWHYTWGFDFGGEFADMAALRVTPTHPGVIAGFQFLYDWNQAMGVTQVQNFISSYMPPNNPPQNDPFITGNLAMMITGDWQVNTMERYAPDVNWDVTYIPVPKAGDKPSTWAGGWSMVVPVNQSRSAALLEGAVRFMTYICGYDGQKKYFLENGNAPTLVALLNERGLFPPNKVYFQETLGFTKSRPALPVGALYWDALSTAQDMVVQNVMTPQAALQQAYDAVQPTLDRFR
jgi:multiple sugar transport system substrate-binding protein